MYVHNEVRNCLITAGKTIYMITILAKQTIQCNKSCNINAHYLFSKYTYQFQLYGIGSIQQDERKRNDFVAMSEKGQCIQKQDHD